MYEYDDECLLTFLKKQSQLFDEPVAETIEAAEAFLEDCMAAVVDSLDEVREYFEERGVRGLCTSERTIFDCGRLIRILKAMKHKSRSIISLRLFLWPLLWHPE